MQYGYIKIWCDVRDPYISLISAFGAVDAQFGNLSAKRGTIACAMCCIEHEPVAHEIA